MKPEEQRIAIAEWCGWKMANSETLDVGYCEPTPYGLDCPQQTIPDYLNDLNAMHEATSNLMDGQLMGYVEQLLCVMHEVSPGYFNSVGWAEASDLITATAAQRAEALLRTIGKWTDTHPTTNVKANE